MTGSQDRRGGHFACRAVLREALTGGPVDGALRAHLEQCSFCAARVRAGARLGSLLRQRPEVPTDALAAMSTRVHEAIVDGAEAGPLGRLLAGAVPPPPAGIDQHGWPEALLESEIARRTAGAPAANDQVSWSRVRSSILDQVVHGRRRRTHRQWWIGLIGTAVAAGLALVLVSRDRSEPPTITFQDIAQLPSGASAPSVDFAIVRRGAPR